MRGFKSNWDFWVSKIEEHISVSFSVYSPATFIHWSQLVINKPTYPHWDTWFIMENIKKMLLQSRNMENHLLFRFMSFSRKKLHLNLVSTFFSCYLSHLCHLTSPWFDIMFSLTCACWNLKKYLFVLKVGISAAEMWHKFAILSVSVVGGKERRWFL